MKKVLLIFVIMATQAACGQKNPDDRRPEAKSYLPGFRELSGTLRLSYKGSGTAFIVKVDERPYVVTALHMFKNNGREPVDFKSGSTLTMNIFYDGKWETRTGNVYYLSNNVDVAVITGLLEWSRKSPYILNDPETQMKETFGQECYFLGYPLGLQMEGIAPVKDFKLTYGLVKKGLISGSNPLPGGGRIIFLDGNNTYGFSGGPVIYWNYTSNRFNLLGVISGYKPQVNEYVIDGVKHKSLENSGIVLVYEAHFIEKIIQTIPNNR